MYSSTQINLGAAAVSLPLNGSFQPNQSNKNKRIDNVSKQTPRILEKKALSKDEIMALPSIRKKPADKEGTANKMEEIGQKKMRKPENREILSNARKRKREADSEPAPAKRARVEDVQQNSNSLKTRVSQTPKKGGLKGIVKTVHVAKRIKWTAIDDQQLRRGYEKYGNKWTLINEEFLEGKFTYKACFQRYMRGIHPNLKRGPWIEEEIQKLQEGVEAYGMAWTKIAQKVFNWTRSNWDCKQKYTQTLDPNIQHGDWTKEESERLIELHNQGKGISLSKCGEMIGRSYEQCFTRYEYFLKNDFTKGKWTAEEIKKLEEGQEKLGNDFRRISKEIFHDERSTKQCSVKMNNLKKML